MKYIVCILLAQIVFNVGEKYKTDLQLTPEFVGKTYKSRVGYVCMETSEPDPCNGLMIDMILVFNEDYVEIITEKVSPCETFRDTLNAHWFMEKDTILFQPGLPYVGRPLLKNNKLWVKNNQLKGIRNNNTNDKIIFEKVQQQEFL